MQARKGAISGEPLGSTPGVLDALPHESVRLVEADQFYPGGSPRKDVDRPRLGRGRKGVV